MLTQQDLQAISHLFDARFDSIDARFDSIDARFDSNDQKFDSIDQKFNSIDQKFNSIDQKFDTLEKSFDEKLDKRLRKSESFLLDEIDRYYNLNKSAIYNLASKMDTMQQDINILKSRNDINNLFEITNRHEERICELEAKVS